MHPPERPSGSAQIFLREGVLMLMADARGRRPGQSWSPKWRDEIVQVLLGMVFSAFAAVIQLVLWPWLASSRFIMFFPAVMLASLTGGGLLAGFSAIFFSTVACFYLFFPPEMTWQFEKETDWIPLIIFVMNGVAINLLAHSVQDRKLAETTTRAEGARRLEFAAKAANVGIWEWEVKNDCLLWDDQMLGLYGLSRDMFTQTVESWRRGLHPDDYVRANAEIAAALRGEKDFDTEFRVVHPDGSERILKANAIVVRDEHGVPERMFGLNRDITEERHAMETLKAAREAAEAAARAKSRFLDIAAHELRTPVTAFSLLLQFTQMQLEMGKPVGADVLGRLRAQVDRLSRLVVDLLEVSKLDRGVVRLQSHPTDLVELVAECQANFQLQFPFRRILFPRPDHPIWLNLDSIRIYEVLSNLLDNAVKYTSKDTLIELQVEDGPDSVRVSVRDYGKGIPEEKQKALFRPFERGDEAEGELYAGLGLGLFICRGIVELHGGKISMKSRPGAGSTFYFDLPRERLAGKAAS
jgi:PAS domain S-box-containing protein